MPPLVLLEAVDSNVSVKYGLVAARAGLAAMRLRIPAAVTVLKEATTRVCVRKVNGFMTAGLDTSEPYKPLSSEDSQADASRSGAWG
jgi:hypothetical protein